MSRKVSKHLANANKRRLLPALHGNVSTLHWMTGRISRSCPIAKCAISKCIESCWKVSLNEDGLELHLSRERKSKKAAFRCEIAGRNLCSFKAVWS